MGLGSGSIVPSCFVSTPVLGVFDEEDFEEEGILIPKWIEEGLETSVVRVFNPSMVYDGEVVSICLLKRQSIRIQVRLS